MDSRVSLVSPKLHMRISGHFRSKSKSRDVNQVLVADRLRQHYRELEQREENARKIWTKLSLDLIKRRSGKIKTHFPMMRIKTIMKLDPTVGPVSRDAAAAISFIAEIFIHEVASLAWVETEKRCASVMTRPDIFQAVKCFDHFDFLADILPYWSCAMSMRRAGER